MYMQTFFAPVMMTVIEIDRGFNWKKKYRRSCRYFKYKCNIHALWRCIFFSSPRGRTPCTCCHTGRVTRKLRFFDHFRGFRFWSFRWTSTGYFSRHVLTVTQSFVIIILLSLHYRTHFKIIVHYHRPTVYFIQTFLLESKHFTTFSFFGILFIFK